MKILVLDYVFPQNHLRLNTKLVECLGEIGEVRVLARPGYYNATGSNSGSVEIVESVNYKDHAAMLGRKISAMSAMAGTCVEVNGREDYYKVVLTFDTVAFAFGRYCIDTRKFFLMHHKNIDELTNPIKRILFKSYMNKVYHIVFEDIFKKYLIEQIGVEEDRIFVIPHPVFCEARTSPEEVRHDCIGLSNSNDEDFIKMIIDCEINGQFFSKNDLHVVLRSKVHSFDNGHLRVISGHLPKGEYDDYMAKTKMVFVPLPESYRFRVSGAIYDAFSHYKYVMASDFPVMKEYKARYPRICSSINNVEDFYATIIAVKNRTVDDLSYELFLRDHRKNVLINEFTRAFRKVELYESNEK